MTSETPPNEPSNYVGCACESHCIRVWKPEEDMDEVELQLLVSPRYFGSSLWKRIRTAAEILWYGESVIDEFILPPERAAHLAELLQFGKKKD